MKRIKTPVKRSKGGKGKGGKGGKGEKGEDKMPKHTGLVRQTQRIMSQLRGHRFDAVQSIHAAALTECPECKAELRRVFGNVGVTFKGSGFYITDYRKPDYEKAAKADKESSKPHKKEDSAKDSGKKDKGSKSDSKDTSGDS